MSNIAGHDNGIRQTHVEPVAPQGIAFRRGHMRLGVVGCHCAARSGRLEARGVDGQARMRATSVGGQ